MSAHKVKTADITTEAPAAQQSRSVGQSGAGLISPSSCPTPFLHRPSETQLMTKPNISVTPKMTDTNFGKQNFNVDFVPRPVCWQVTLFFRRFYLPVSFISHDDASVIRLVNNRKIQSKQLSFDNQPDIQHFHDYQNLLLASFRC